MGIGKIEVCYGQPSPLKQNNILKTRYCTSGDYFLNALPSSLLLFLPSFPFTLTQIPPQNSIKSPLNSLLKSPLKPPLNPSQMGDNMDLRSERSEFDDSETTTHTYSMGLG